MKVTRKIIEIDEDGKVHAPQTKAQLRVRIEELEEERDRYRACIEEAVATMDLPPHINDGFERVLAGEGVKNAD